MIRTLMVLVSVFVLSAVPVTASAEVTANPVELIVNPGEQFNVGSADVYTFTGEFSDTNRELSYGVNLNAGQYFKYYVGNKTGFDIYAIVTTGPYASGEVIMAPNTDLIIPNETLFSDLIIPNGTSFTFLLSGDYFPGQTNWLTMAIGDDAVSIINSQYGGTFQIGPVTTMPVPEPQTWAMMFAGLGMVGFMARRRTKIQIS